MPNPTVPFKFLASGFSESPKVQIDFDSLIGYIGDRNTGDAAWDSLVVTGDSVLGLGPLTGLTVAATTGGTLPADTYYYNVYPVDASGNVGDGDHYSTIVIGGANNAVNLTWNAVEGVSTYRVCRATIPDGYDGYYNISGSLTSYKDTNSAFTSTAAPYGTIVDSTWLKVNGFIVVPASLGGLAFRNFETGLPDGYIQQSSAGELVFQPGHTGAAAGNYVFADQNGVQEMTLSRVSTHVELGVSDSGGGLGDFDLTIGTNLNIRNGNVTHWIFKAGSLTPGTDAANALGTGALRFTDLFLSSTLTNTSTSNQIVLGTTRTVTLTAPTPATTSRIYTFPDLGGAYSIVGSIGTQTVSGIKTFDTQLIGKGTATNDNAAAGYIGESVRSLVTIASAVSSTGTGQFFDITSISLTTGDWSVSGIIRLAQSGATVTANTCAAAISINSGNTTTDHVGGDNAIDMVDPTAAADRYSSIPNYRLSLSGTTTVYLKANIGFSAGTPKASGRISAKRIR